MKFIAWDVQKNEKLKRERGISFEDVMNAIVEGSLLIILDHPNKKRYAYQKMYVIEFHGYAYGVPCVENEETIFMKTIFPSRKYTKQYLEKGVL